MQHRCRECVLPPSTQSIRSVYGIKLIVLTRNFNHEYPLCRIYSHPLPLYKPTQEESETLPDIEVLFL
jgi:hypothetical protein